MISGIAGVLLFVLRWPLLAVLGVCALSVWWLSSLRPPYNDRTNCPGCVSPWDTWAGIDRDHYRTFRMTMADTWPAYTRYVTAKAGWYPDPGGVAGLFRYWDGKAWSAATSPNPSAPPPTLGLGSSATSAPPTTGSTAIQDTGQLGSAPPGTGGPGSAPATGALGSGPGTPGYGSSTGYGQQASGQQPLRTASPYTDLQ